MNQWSRIKSTEINPYISGQLILDKGTRNIQCEKDRLFDGVGKLNIHMQKNRSRPLSYTTHKNNPKWD